MTNRKTKEDVIAEFSRLGYRVNGDTWDWCVADHDVGVYVSDGQESAVCNATALVADLRRLDDSHRDIDVWDAIDAARVSH